MSRPTASEHLAKLVEARLLAVTRKRRFAYYRIASPLVAQMLESIKAVAAIEVPPRHQPRSAPTTRCASRAPATIISPAASASPSPTRLSAAGHVILSDDGGEVTDSGARFLTRFGATLTPKANSHRIYCRPCLDWSERRHHVAGFVGAEICRCCLERGWLTRMRDTRALRLTPEGRAGLAETFGVQWADGGSLRVHKRA